VRDLSCDVLVVGGGPAGASVARAAAAAGADVVLAERRNVIGRPVRCAEYIPAMLAGQADVGREYVVQEVQGLRAYLDGECIQDLAAPGYMINRDVFDQALAKAAEKAGARVLVGCAAIGRGDDGRVRLRCVDGSEAWVAPRVVVGADGPFSRVARWAGISGNRCLPAVQVRLPLRRPLTHTHVHFGEAYPAGYAWLFPKGNEANVGIGMVCRPGSFGLAATLRDFVREMVRAGLVADGPGTGTCGWAPVAGRDTFVVGDTALVGDAAGHTHPITGAGVFQAVVGGAMAGRWAARAAHERDVTLLRGYAKEWAEFYGETLAHAEQRRRLWEGHAGPVGEIIRRCWIGFREYYVED
jgi:geranylgeranyl reductase family protein